MVRMLLEKSATVNAFDKKDRRAIHWAAYMGHVDVVKMLVDHGAEINCRDKQVCPTSCQLLPVNSLLLTACTFAHS